ncbi:hypothetical protein CPB85DRAFT_749259 [Mucidula mucida]|nr:hypothetical protein CPB85DRAFT_749259 [Mucidula mucida]
MSSLTAAMFVISLAFEVDSRSSPLNFIYLITGTPGDNGTSSCVAFPTYKDIDAPQTAPSSERLPMSNILSLIACLLQPALRLCHFEHDFHHHFVCGSVNSSLLLLWVYNLMSSLTAAMFVISLAFEVDSRSSPLNFIYLIIGTPGDNGTSSCVAFPTYKDIDAPQTAPSSERLPMSNILSLIACLLQPALRLGQHIATG